MYQSPISIYETAMKTIMEYRENAIVAKVQDAFDVQVDKEELILALQYDRNQYEAGYRDGKADAMAEVVRCKDCKNYCHDKRYGTICNHPALDYDVECYAHWVATKPDDFCSYGERRNNGKAD